MGIMTIISLLWDSTVVVIVHYYGIFDFINHEMVMLPVYHSCTNLELFMATTMRF
jgi:hypothetical protein